MFGSAILEVAIGLIFIYTVLAVVCSMIQERIAQIMGWRASMLKEGIERLLLDPDVVERFYAHPMIKSLGREKHGKTIHPAYIPCQTFTTVVWDVVTNMVSETTRSKTGVKADDGAVATADSTGKSLDPLVEAYREILTTTRELPESDFRTTTLAFLKVSGQRVDIFKENIEDWFGNSMDRVSSWYKQKSQLVVLFLAVTLTIAGNVDTIQLADTLWSEPVTRQGLATLAEGYAAEDEAQLEDEENLAEIHEQLAALDLPFGWGEGLPTTKSAILSKIIGLLLTAFAVSLGAPFWFDLLKKAVRLSGSYKALPRKQEAAAT